MVEILYGKGSMTCPVEPDAVLTAHGGQEKAALSGSELVRQAMEAPIGSEPLSVLAKGKARATVIISDHTRPVPSKDILPRMLQELREGNPDIQITLLVATGCHRGTTKDELVAKLGKEIAEREQIKVHDAFAKEDNVEIGILPSGAPLVIDRAAVETDLLVAEGFIEPHFFAGFSGGRKSVLPGVCGATTVYGNHCGAFIADEHSRTGVLGGNPIHRDMIAAAEMAELAYIVNVVIDDDKNTVAAFAGDPVLAHEAGVNWLKDQCAVRAVPADIVITSNGGAPMDQNLYQCVKGLTAAEATANPGAVLIICAEAADGIGGEGFYRSLLECEDAAELYEAYCATPQNETIPDQWQTQILARILMKHRVIFVSRKELAETIREMKMDYAETLEEALAMARETVGESGTVTAIPNGISVIVLAE